ncbi:acyl carrier protein [uncultured Sneathia sp.]|nr:acyl carrier protein [uncultured Sneathia sp.]
MYELSYKKSMFEEIKEILLEQLDIDEKDIKLESKLIDDLGADSLDVAEIVSAVENKFNLEFSKEDLNKVETIQDIIDLLEKNNKR